MRKYFLKTLLGATLILVFSLLPHLQVYAEDIATVRISGPAVTVATKSKVEMSVLLDTNVSINAFDLEVAFPADKLKFLGFNNAGSIANIWPTTPEMGESGNLKISGGIIRGFSGSSGLIIKLSFEVLRAGDAEVSFIKSNLYKADGKGTEINADGKSFSLSVANNGKLSALPPAPKDATPPDLSLEVVENPADNSSLVVFNANDPESGIKDTELRIKKWSSFSSWQRVENPFIYPSGAWAFEVRATNYAGGESVTAFSSPKMLFFKVILLMLSCFGLVICARAVYNKWVS